MSGYTLIPRKGGPLDGRPYLCLNCIYRHLVEGQIVKSYHRVSGPFPNRLCVKELTYSLQMDGNGDWELVYDEEEVES